jgi:RNA polymerase, sigma 32 subunit, RpoH
MTTAVAMLGSPQFPAPKVGSIDSYLQWVSQVPVLSAEDESRLAERLHRDGDLEAARTLVLSNLRFVAHVARGYLGYGLPFADLIQEGNIGLMKAVKRFDPQVGVRLISFAVHWIRAEIHEYILRNWRIVRVATTKAQRKLFFNLRRAKHRLGWLNAGEVAAVAEDLRVRPEDVVRMEQRLSGHDVSFAANPADDEDASFGPEDYLAADTEDPAAAVEEADWQAKVGPRLQQALAKLDPRSRDILERRWLRAEGEKSGLKELGQEYGVSAERVRQIEGTALGKLRNALAPVV